MELELVSIQDHLFMFEATVDPLRQKGDSLFFKIYLHTVFANCIFRISFKGETSNYFTTVIRSFLDGATNGTRDKSVFSFPKCWGKTLLRKLTWTRALICFVREQRSYFCCGQHFYFNCIMSWWFVTVNWIST